MLFFSLRTHSVAGAPSFTSRGFKYYHLFNMNLCGDKYEEAVCSSNISLSTGKSVSNILAEETELEACNPRAGHEINFFGKEPSGS